MGRCFKVTRQTTVVFNMYYHTLRCEMGKIAASF